MERVQETMKFPLNIDLSLHMQRESRAPEATSDVTCALDIVDHCNGNRQRRRSRKSVRAIVNSDKIIGGVRLEGLTSRITRDYTNECLARSSGRNPLRSSAKIPHCRKGMWRLITTWFVRASKPCSHGSLGTLVTCGSFSKLFRVDYKHSKRSLGIPYGRC